MGSVPSFLGKSNKRLDNRPHELSDVGTEVNNTETPPLAQDTQSADLINARDVIPSKRPLCLSPGRERDLTVSIPDTPKGDDINRFRYYCPICMNYFKDIMRTSCCGNYVCLQCCKDYLLTHGMEANSVNDILGNANLVKRLSCPNCATIGFEPQMADLGDDIRDYRNQELSHASRNINLGFSPLKAGDSFENLKRKMVLYKADDNPANVVKSENITLFSESNSIEKSIDIQKSVATSVVNGIVDSVVMSRSIA